MISLLLKTFNFQAPADFATESRFHDHPYSYLTMLQALLSIILPLGSLLVLPLA